MSDKSQALTPMESRQALSRRLNLRVLVLSMALAIVIAAMIYYAIYSNPRGAIGIPDEPAAPAAGEQTTP